MLKATSSPTVETSFNDEFSTEIEDCGDDQFVNHLHSLACRVAQAGDAEARRHVTSELLLPAALHLWLDREALSVSTPVTLSTRNA